MSETSKQPAAERPHHPYSPSKLGMLEWCPGWTGNNESSAASLRGTAQHDAFESRDFSKLSDGEVDAVQRCLAETDELVDSYRAAYGVPPIIEQETYNHVDDDDTSAGYLDLAIIAPDYSRADIVDLKFGKWPVEPAETNVQGIAYMMGLKRKYPKLARCRVTFMLPYQDTIDSHEFELTDEEVARHLTRIRTIVARAKNPDAPRQPATSACLFCGNLGKCPAAAKAFLHVSKKFSPLQVPDNVTPTTMADQHNAGQVLQVADLAKTWGEAVRRVVSAECIERGQAPEGYEIITSSRRKVLSVAKLREVAQAHLPQEIIDEATRISLTPLEEAIAASAPRGSKKNTLEDFQALLETAGAVAGGEPYAYLAQVRGEAPKD